MIDLLSCKRGNGRDRKLNVQRARVIFRDGDSRAPY